MRLRMLNGSLLLFLVLLCTSIRAQESSPAQTFSPEELEQIAAPIALYPDALVAQIFMASTYPLEIVAAARWAKENPGLTGSSLDEALKDQNWDPSVKSLVSFPQVLTMMNEKLDWTQKLGDAFLAQQQDIMYAVQRLRGRAQEAGNLKSNEQQVVTAAPSPADYAGPPQTIIIESSKPDVIYVPSYDPVYVYGAWPYAAYPPYYYYPPGYTAGAALLTFGVGMAMGAAIWGDCDWGGGDVDIDINRETNFNRNTNRETNRETNRTGDRSGDRSGGKGGKEKWQHNPEHRKGVGYRDQGTQQRFGQGTDRAAVQSREQFRGRADQGRQELSGPRGDQARQQISDRGGAAGDRSGSVGDRGGAGTRDLGSGTGSSGSRASAGTRDLGGGAGSSGSRGSSAGTRDLGSSRGTSSSRDRGAFSGSSSGSASRSQANRGYSSRSSGGRSAGGMSRGGGGGGRRR